MQHSQLLRTDATQVSVSTQPATHAPLIVHRETLLRDLPPYCGQEYVLIADDCERIIGIVSCREIDSRLLSSNQHERVRWAAMPVGAMSKLSFADTTHSVSSITEREFSCAAIHEHGNLFGLAVEGDLFLSWKRLETLFTAALSDPLTGLMNRLAYERRLREEWSRAERTDASIGVVVVDLDDFKSVNDTYGHVVGDELLARVGHKLEAAMRSYDVVARFGGDEFVALCLGCEPGEIRIPMTRLINSLSEIEVNVRGEKVSIHASVGGAVRHSNFTENQPEDLFIAADNCLYEAKKTRNSGWKIEFGCENHLTLQQISSGTNIEIVPV
jgi:diguanylate cyclase (GGDEF)-like protein